MPHIGDIAEQVLDEVRSAGLTKIAEHQIVRAESAKPRARTELGTALLKVAEELRSADNDITVGDLTGFLNGVRNAIRTP